MQYIKIVKFNNPIICDRAIAKINKGEGIPAENSLTDSYTSRIDLENDFCYFLADNITDKYYDSEDFEIEEVPLH